MLIIVGIALVVISGRMSALRVKGVHGRVDDVTVKMSEGTGVVPKWMSLMGLVGYAVIVVGVISLFV